MTRDPTWTEQRLTEQRRRTDAELAHVERELLPPPVPLRAVLLGLAICGLVVAWVAWGVSHG